MDEKDLVIGEMYYSRWLDTPVKYTGVEMYEGEKHYAFWESKNRLSHWLRLNSVTRIEDNSTNQD